MFINYLDNIDRIPMLIGISAVFIYLFVFAALILMLISKWKLYQKAGKKGWEGIIPVYNIWVLVEIAGLKWWFFFVASASNIIYYLGLGDAGLLINIISLIGMFFCNYSLALKFKKEPILYGIGLTVLPIVFLPILAFGNADYDFNIENSPYGLFTEEEVNEFLKAKRNDTSSTNQKSTKTKQKANFCKNCGSKIGKDKFCSSCGAEIK